MDQKFVEADAIKYFLGDLPESDAEKFEDRCYSDDQLFEQMRTVEDNLILKHLHQRMSSTEIGKFEKHYLVAPARRERYEFEKKLVEVSKEMLERLPPEEGRAVETDSLWHSFLNLFRGLNLSLGLATAALLLAIGGTWLFIKNQRLQQQQVALERQAQELKDKLANQEGNQEKLRADLEKLKKQLDESKGATPHPSEKPTPEKPTEEPNLIAQLTFEPGGKGSDRRGSGNKPTLELSSGTKTVRISVKVDTDEFINFQVIVKRDGEVITSQSGLKARGQVVTITWPASIFTAKDYVLILKGVTRTRETLEVDNYNFQVVRQ